MVNNTVSLGGLLKPNKIKTKKSHATVPFSGKATQAMAAPHSSPTEDVADGAMAANALAACAVGLQSENLQRFLLSDS
jgi:hypothetical protein